MADFFKDKIEKIHDSLSTLQDSSFPLNPDIEFQHPGDEMNDFSQVTEDDIRKIIEQAAPKSCCLDPVPTKLIKACLDILLPLITRIINQSLSTSTVPKAFKLAAITPILKKANLIVEILKNFRPIANLPFLSKVLEKVANKQLLHHKDIHGLREKFASAYRAFHSTETALLMIQHDLLLSLDKKQCVIMVMLDLSAAFDTVNHEQLLNRLHTTFGIRGNAHSWVKSYLTDRRQFVTIKGERSIEQIKTCDVPQGSILGPNLYEDYTTVPVGAIFRKHDIRFHIYADDKQAYHAFNPGELPTAIHKVQSCIDEIRQWMAMNWLKLNNDKTECIIFGSKKNLNGIDISSVRIGDADIAVSDSVKSIGAIFDSTLSMEAQIQATCRAAWYHLHMIGKIRKYLTIEQTKTIIHSYVTNRIDQNNSLLLGLPKKSLSRLQIVQNAAARLILSLKKRDHITPALMLLHWLPVEKRILFKVMLIIYKSLHQKGPGYFSDMLVPYVPSRALRSAQENKLCVQDCHYADTRKRAFGIRGPSEWNKLPLELKSKPSVDSFKKALKTHLYRQAYLIQ